MRVDAVATGISILIALAEQDSWGITELSERIGEHKSRTHRHVNTLVELGLVAKDPETARYFLSWGLAELLATAGPHNILRKLVRPALLKLVGKCHARAQFAILKDGTNFVVETIDGKYPMQLLESAGTRRPPYFGASGKVLMAYTDAETRKILIPPKMEQFTPDSLSDRADFENKLEPIRRNGFALSDQEAVKWVKALAVPVFSTRGALVGALSVALPAQEFKPSTQATLLKQLSSCAKEISEALRLDVDGASRVDS